ncbi:hypothetical protein FO440_02450 [Mucilaginibacter corticis]|uniref:Sugar 3,4-ketoisomerase QdtA cupin domain-containing protein n=1 Tax=Mucilaginibacter corticis TaxID=2597670 RepID=A0A556MSZ9_9SPHI|nr:WxcM-like domain-containing protein [Mucilaginibacter corticis]TSJ43071.1 hypothetical protein FO440_02450 [Mucilaginibacter corticis]
MITNSKPALIQGSHHTDQRGTLSFVNDFDMADVKRFYIIQNADLKITRGWRAHRIERRWFYVSDGAFRIRIVKIDNWENPDKHLPVEEFILSADQDQVLSIPVGYGSSIQAISEKSKLIVFADYGIENATKDDFLYPQDYFEA